MPRGLMQGLIAFAAGSVIPPVTMKRPSSCVDLTAGCTGERRSCLSTIADTRNGRAFSLHPSMPFITSMPFIASRPLNASILHDHDLTSPQE